MTAYNVLSRAGLLDGKPEDISLVLANLDAIAAVLNANLGTDNWSAGKIFDVLKLMRGTAVQDSVLTWRDGDWKPQAGDRVFNVYDYGTVDSAGLTAGAAGNTAAFNAAIAACVTAGGGIVYIPRGTYALQPTVALTLNSHALYVGGNNVTIRGAGRHATKLVFYIFGGLNPNTNYELVGGVVNRGHGIFVDNTVTGFTLEDLEYAGMPTAGGGYTNNNIWPANPGTGDGWDITHKCVYVSNNSVHDNVRVRRCNLHDWRGEIIYHGGGVESGRYVVEDCELHDTNGDGISITGQCSYRRNEIYNCAFAGIEDIYTSLSETIEDNYIHNCLQGMSLGSDPGVSSWGPVTVKRNRIVTCLRNGIYVGKPQSIEVADNTLVDCANATNYAAINMDNTSGTIALARVAIRRNVIRPLTTSTYYGILIGTSLGATDVDVTDNILSGPAGWGGFDVNIGVSGTTTRVLFARNHRGTNPNRSVGGPFTAGLADDIIVALADAITITLPSAAGIGGQQYIIKRAAAGGTGVTVATTGGQTIDGAATYLLSSTWATVTVVSNGSNWYTI